MGALGSKTAPQSAPAGVLPPMVSGASHNGRSSLAVRSTQEKGLRPRARAATFSVCRTRQTSGSGQNKPYNRVARGAIHARNGVVVHVNKMRRFVFSNFSNESKSCVVAPSSNSANILITFMSKDGIFLLISPCVLPPRASPCDPFLVSRFVGTWSFTLLLLFPLPLPFSLGVVFPLPFSWAPPRGIRRFDKSNLFVSDFAL